MRSLGGGQIRAKSVRGRRGYGDQFGDPGRRYVEFPPEGTSSRSSIFVSADAFFAIFIDTASRASCALSSELFVRTGPESGSGTI